MRFSPMPKKNGILLALLTGLVLGVVGMVLFNAAVQKTSTNDYCMSCHVHVDADAAWKMSSHYNNPSGTKTDCAACHLPPKGSKGYYSAKVKTGMKDLWAYWTKDKEELDFESKKELEHAVRIVYNASCKECHVNLFPEGISDDGVIAHLYYEENEKKLGLQCISCHLDVGHFNPNYQHQKMTGVPVKEASNAELYTEPYTLETFADFEETIPGTTASIRMVAVPGGSFRMGSPENEPFRGADESPQRNVTVSSFFMGETEVTWDQYWAFYAETMSEGRTPPEEVYANNAKYELDAISGPTPPFGFPDQGWGMGERPALTMTHYAAETFCEWLSLKTGKHYRLPTEAEWEYAARGGTDTPYFFEGSPRKFSGRGFRRHFSKADTSVIASSIIYAGNSKSRTAEPSRVRANPFGLKNMSGNVLEYCSDWYAPDAYEKMADGAVDPKGPESGTEHVVRGGLYSDDAADVRSASRRHTEHDAWLRTDPQNPKSIWWYSDIKGIGFRVVCELPQELKQ